MCFRFGRMPWVSAWLFIASTVLAAAPPGDQLRQVVRQLDSDDEAVRQDAGRSLLNAGDLAIAPLVERIQLCGASCAARSVHILGQIAAQGDENTLQLLTEALSQPGQKLSPELAKIADAVETRHARLKVERAVAKIRALGGTFEGDTVRGAGAARAASITGPAARVSSDAKPQADAGSSSAAPPEIRLEDILPREGAAVPTAGLIGDAFVADTFLTGAENAEPEARLTIGEPWRGTDRDLALLRELPHLTVVVLHGAPLTDAALAQLSGLPRLEVLEIDCCHFSEEKLAQFRRQQPQIRVIVRVPSEADDSRPAGR
jgi:hypothetical protein